jgi:hypothetical protein
MEAYKQIEEWKQEEVKKLIDYIYNVRTKISEWKTNYGYVGMNQLEDYRKISNVYKELSRMSDETIQSESVKIIDKHFEMLQSKVVDKIGTIQEIVPIGDNGFDYQFIGENGKVQIKVVNAGGWNIQVHHTRWTIAKIK